MAEDHRRSSGTTASRRSSRRHSASSVCSTATAATTTNHFTLRPFRRVPEEETIVKALDASSQGVQVVLVQGASGVGKSLLVRVALQDNTKAWMGTAKSEFQRSPLPFAPLRQLLADIGNQVLEAPLDVQLLVKEELRMGLTKNHQLLLREAVPSLGDILGVQRDSLLSSSALYHSSTFGGSFHNASFSIRSSSNLNNNNNNMNGSSSSHHCNNNHNHSNHTTTTSQSQHGRAEIITKNGLDLLKLATRAFFKAITSVRPTVIVFDDIMWSDEASLYVLLSLLTDETQTNLLFCATYRDKIAQPQDEAQLRQWKSTLAERLPPHRIHEIHLENLNLPQVTQLLANSMGYDCHNPQCPIHYNSNQDPDDDEQEQSTSNNNNTPDPSLELLARVFCKQTKGNPFFIAQLVDNLYATNAITWNDACHQWTWELDDISRRVRQSPQVVTVVSKRLERLPHDMLGILKLASCLGSRFTLASVQACQSIFEIDVLDESLELLCQQDFLVRLDDEQYKFFHDTIQLAAYSLIATTTCSNNSSEGEQPQQTTTSLQEEEDKEEEENESKIDDAQSSDSDDLKMIQLHWNIGRLLLELIQQQDETNDDWLFFACVDQLNLGQQFAADSVQWCSKVAKLNLKAGKKAAALSAFQPSSVYLQEGIDVLGNHLAFDRQEFYDLAIQLHSLFAKTEFCIGHIEESRALANLVVEHAKTAKEKESPYLTLISCYFASNGISEGVDFCLDRLESLGVKLPRKPSSLQASLEHQRLLLLLRGKSNPFWLSLPRMKDETKAVALRILCELVLHAHQIGRTALLCFITSHMIRISIDYGSSKFTAEAFACIGAHLSSHGHIKEGARFGSLAEELFQQSFFNRKQYKGRTYLWVATCTKWMEPLTHSLDLLTKGNEFCMAAGEMVYACQCQVMYSTHFFYSGLALDPLLQDVAKFCSLMLEYQHYTTFQILSPLWQCLLNLTGNSKDPKNMQAGLAIEKRKMVMNKANTGQQFLNSYWMQVAYYLGDYEKASELAEELKSQSEGLTKAMVYYPARVFFFTLIAIHNFRVTRKRKYKVEAWKYLKTFKKLVMGGAVNVVHKLQLLKAEMSGLSTRKSVDKVIDRYALAISSARRAGYIQDAALANYLCFQFCHNRQEKEIKGHYLQESLSLWKMWDAVAVANSLRRRHPEEFRTLASVQFNNGSFRSRTVFDASLMEQHKFLPV
ncbi:Protein tyrosine kinase [Seminavis robusta]|uniref:Protein tyrosine kinase n=1 Tax=Seminavis robusta TaxID=568900 RepID=A0A9N8EC55_9STRA|nr:Protein tyrosine kinase [Seminavis robusta]|eukprot:Sro741_g195690.1 Protein tyrosine kinase (1204) ;mRNA; f:12314-16113